MKVPLVSQQQKKQLKALSSGSCLCHPGHKEDGVNEYHRLYQTQISVENKRLKKVANIVQDSLKSHSWIQWSSTNFTESVDYSSVNPRSGDLQTQKLRSHLMRIQSWKVLSLKPGVGQYIAINATLTAWNFFLAYFCPSGPFTCIFFQNLSQFFPVLAVANTGSCVGPQNKIGHPVGCKFPCWVPAEYR